MKTSLRLASISRAALLASLLFGSAFALADDLSEKDRDFLQGAVLASHYELDGSKLAVTKSSNALLIRYARKTVQDFTLLTNQLDLLAKKKAPDISAELNAAQQDNLQTLSAKEGAEFDAEYAARIAEEAHANVVEYFTDAAEEADDPEIKAFAKKHQPALKQQLFVARNLNNKVNP